ncbi:leucine-rich repeat receptor protein kinase HPCA1-like isoform X5 [Silene latifolia]|uniref:leucine-rich repeat receptor protein kinase HPCA1-like isoform X5 n=1 Tax=Silene latifolia TaxID=37657 RepID=UPI003D7865F1
MTLRCRLAVAVLLALKEFWKNVPPSWNRVNDPCGSHWEGIECKGSRVISITLSSMGLIGTLSGDIQGLSELQTLDLSYNKGLSGRLPPAIGKLSKLTNLILAGCNFNGELPDTIGSLSRLTFLHFGKNQLSGEITPQLFNENMTMLHLLLDNNQFSGNIPTTLSLVKTLEVIRFDWNSLSGSVPSSINNSLTILSDMLLSNNQLTGPIPDLAGMSLLTYLDMSNNSFEVSDVPEWFTALPSLTTLMMERCHIQGTIPAALFRLPHLERVVLKNNDITGVLDLGAVQSSQLQLVDLQNNNISAHTQRPGDKSLQLIPIHHTQHLETVHPSPVLQIKLSAPAAIVHILTAELLLFEHLN